MFGLLFLAVLQAPPSASASPIDLAEAKAAFALHARLAAADGGALWGHSLGGPMLFVEPRTRFAVGSQADAEGKLKAQDGVFVGTLPAEVPIANFATRWAGVQWAMILWPLPKDPAERAVLLMHEPYHGIQAALKLPAANPANAQLDGALGRTLLQLEWRALAKALQTAGAEQRQAVADALAFRAARRQGKATVATEENALEINEGLAEYTGVKLSGLADAAQRLLAVKRIEERPAALKSFCRSFAYVSGPAYGLLLDQHAPGWRAKLEAKSDLGALLAAALTIDAGSGSMDWKATAERYGGAKLLAAEEARAAEREKRVAECRKLLAEGPTLELPLVKMQMSFDPSNVLPVEGLGTVYPTLTLIDAWGKLEVKKAARITADFKQAFVPAPTQTDGPVLQGDGWELQLAEGWKAVPGGRSGNWRLEKK